MAFSNIDPTTPAGNEKKKFGDDRIREFKQQTIDNLTEISNYPASTKPALKTAIWTTATRPSGTELVDRVTGYNTDLGYEEYYDLATTTWKMKLDAISFGGNGVSKVISTDLNTVNKIGFYYCYLPTNSPAGKNGYLIVEAFDTSFIKQAYSNFDGTGDYARYNVSGTWGAWKQKATTDGTVAIASNANLLQGYTAAQVASVFIEGLNANPGYIKLPNGYIRNFGNVDVGANSNITITFAKPFQVYPLSVTVTDTYDNISTYSLVKVIGRTATTITIQNANEITMNIPWSAEGW